MQTEFMVSGLNLYVFAQTNPACQYLEQKFNLALADVVLLEKDWQYYHWEAQILMLHNPDAPQVNLLLMCESYFVLMFNGQPVLTGLIALHSVYYEFQGAVLGYLGKSNQHDRAVLMYHLPIEQFIVDSTLTQQIRQQLKTLRILDQRNIQQTQAYFKARERSWISYEKLIYRIKDYAPTMCSLYATKTDTSASQHHPNRWMIYVFNEKNPALPRKQREVVQDPVTGKYHKVLPECIQKMHEIDLALADLQIPETDLLYYHWASQTLILRNPRAPEIDRILVHGSRFVLVFNDQPVLAGSITRWTANYCSLGPVLVHHRLSIQHARAYIIYQLLPSYDQKAIPFGELIGNPELAQQVQAHLRDLGILDERDTQTMYDDCKASGQLKPS